MSGGSFRADEILTALVAAGGAQGLLYLAFASSSPAAVRADISDERSRPIAVAITPVSAIPSASGQHHRAPLPHAWRRHPAESVANEEAPPVSMHHPPPDAGPPRVAVLRPLASPAPSASSEPAGPAPAVQPAAPVAPPGAAEGAGGPPGAEEMGPGGEADPLKARAIALYRSALVAWFMARFDIRGKIPFETLKNLRATAVVSVAADQTVSGFTLASGSGNAVFDAQVRATLAGIQSGGAPLPPPPPLYPDLLGGKLTVSFKCTARGDCE